MASITRATGKLALAGIRNQAVARGPTGALSSLLHPLSVTASFQQERGLATAAEEEYYKQKQAAKALRTQRFNERKAHKEKVKHRLDGKPKHTRRRLFEAWYNPKVKADHIAAKEARELGLDWKIEVAVVLERIPIILPDKPKWESDYDNLRTYLDQFGRQYPEQLVGTTEIEEIEDLTDEALLANHNPKGFVPAPRETEADHNGDVRTLNRRLKTWVFLTVKEKVETPEGEKDLWRLPTVELKGEETILEAGQRAISEKVGKTMDIWYPSNCPMTVDMRVFTEEERAQHGNAYGVKKFFMVVQHDEGNITPDDIFVDDFAWFEKKELVERIEEQEGEEKAKLYFYLLNDIWRYQL